ncbi:MAG: PhzF family phenazine biosynthesis isomerase [Aliivibrio sp.]|uniref:PhzF family phenazine biosynthesis protein n=1 Tax=Aliivibrio sp. TaxID=1872443 RepID=UPI001A62B398|nr:PhzF family phenazine biosynthesis isomerase [Aliivibrio sp.]
MHNYVIADSFCDRPFTGNPVAIFFDCDNLSSGKMQAIASQMNLSETTFICRPNGEADANIRIFTPVNELPFAGHPLIGTALAVSLMEEKDSVVFETLKGNFRFNISNENYNGNNESAYIDMEMPKPIVTAYEHKEDLLLAAKLKHSTLPIELYDVGPRHVFVGVKNEASLAKISPDIKRLAEHQNMALLCFCKCDDHWRLRMFSPAYGVIEDAATGSAAAPLALHLARHGLIGFGDEIKIVQGIEMGRESVMYGTAGKEDGGFFLKAGGQVIIAARGVYFD